MPPSRRPLVYDGATTIGLHILPHVAPLYERLGGSFARIGDCGTNRGLEAVRAGDADVAGIARDLTAAEKDELASALVGHDALGVFVNSASPIRDLTKAQLKGIFTVALRNWREVGGPDRPIVPITEVKTGGRGTVLELRRIALDGAEYGPTIEFEDAPDCLKEVARNAGAISVASMAMAIDGTRTIAIDGIEPTPEHVRAGRYLLARPMYLVARRPPGDDVQCLFDVLLSDDAQRIVARSFTPAR